MKMDILTDHPVRDGLEKLAAHGSVEQIRDYLVERGITALPGYASACVIAEFLEEDGWLNRGDAVSVQPKHVRINPPNVTVWDAGCYSVYQCLLPEVLADLAIRFDQKEFPELVHGH